MAWLETIQAIMQNEQIEAKVLKVNVAQEIFVSETRVVILQRPSRPNLQKPSSD